MPRTRAIVYVYGQSAATVLFPDELGAIVREHDDNSETWFPWHDLKFNTLTGTGLPDSPCQDYVPLTFTLTIELGGEGMTTYDDISGALTKAAATMHNVFTDAAMMPETGIVRDVNGNTVGSWGVK